MRRDRLIESCRRLGPWFHQIDLGDGVLTRDVSRSSGPQPLDHPLPRWHKIKDVLPADMRGMKVLDVGCSDGFFSFEMARRGAELLCVDSFATSVARLRWARKQLGLRHVSSRFLDFYDIEHGITRFDRLRYRVRRRLWWLGQVLHLKERHDYHYVPRRFDLVFMFALLYHLKAPMEALEQAAQLADVLFIETIAVEDETNPHMLYQVPMAGVTDRPKWFPTTRCLKDMLHWAGYRHVVEIAGPEDKRPIYLAYKDGADLSRWKLPGG